MMTSFRLSPVTGAVLLAAVSLRAQTTSAGSSSALTVDRIFLRGEFFGEPMPDVRWLKDGRSYVELRPAEGGGTDIVRVDAATGQATTLVDAASLVDGHGRRFEVEDLALSDDETRGLLFHNSVRVWRTNTRGVYEVVDFRTKRLTPVAAVRTPGTGASSDADTAAAPALGKSNEPSYLARGVQTGLQMFAKFSPDGRKVAFVRDNNLFVTELTTGRARALTNDGSADIINGTTDWVYEEELDLRDAFRWSPDSRRIAYWRFDQSRVPAYPMVDEMGVYPSVATLRYPKAGQPNSRVRLGILDVARATTRWLDVGGDTGIYIPRVEWSGSDSVVVQRMPRRQNRVDVLLLSASSGRGRTILTDRDSAYVDVQDPVWLRDGRQFIWMSDRDGWRRAYLYNRDGSLARPLTPAGTDALAVVGSDEARGIAYVLEAAPNATQRQVFAYNLAGGGRRRVTGERGSHTVSIAPRGRYMLDVASGIDTPPSAAVYELSSAGAAKRRLIAPNTSLRSSIVSLGIRPTEFFRVPMPDGTQLDAYRILPPAFDSTKKYPVLMYVYGGPASPTVVDTWGSTRYLWHQMLAQRGYVVVSVDNRGAAWRGRDFRKITQYHLGRYESRDQIDVARWLGRQRWVDKSRIGIWGWSYGGYLSALTAEVGGSLFKTALVVAPVTDWRLYDTIYTERYMWLPQENAEGYRDAAPQAHVGGLTATMLLVYGTGDDNVHPQNSLQLANRLEAERKAFWMLAYPNRTHSISGGNTQASLFDQLTRFVTGSL